MREKSVTDALDSMGLYWKRDLDFVPVKDKNTVWFNVALGGRVVELLATCPQIGRAHV